MKMVVRYYRKDEIRDDINNTIICGHKRFHLYNCTSPNFWVKVFNRKCEVFARRWGKYYVFTPIKDDYVEVRKTCFLDVI